VRSLLSFVAIVLTFVGYVPYVRSILRRETKPHVFSWIIWGSTTFIGFFAPIEGGGGAGAWPIGVSGTVALLVAFLAWRFRGDTSVTASDRLFFGLALASLPLWYLTADPLWSVVVLTLADTLGIGPTLRKAYRYPAEENLTFWTLFVVRNGVASAALERWSTTTLLFPVVTGASCLGLVFLVLWRRSIAPDTDPSSGV